MRSLLLALALATAGCIVVPAHTYYRSPGPPPPQPAAAGPRLLSEQEAVDVAFHFARSRGLQVDRVSHAHMDRDARWHVEVRGHGHDRAKVMVDARSGRVLRASLRDDKGRDEGELDD
jgi:hypothetical protein